VEEREGGICFSGDGYCVILLYHIGLGLGWIRTAVGGYGMACIAMAPGIYRIDYKGVVRSSKLGRVNKI
jgi:hypothetical protein